MRALYNSQLTRHVENMLYEHMSQYGYETVTLPVIESADLFLTRASDRIINRLLTFERFSKQLALRPEFTAAAAYQYLTHKATEPVRWQFSGVIFEDTPDDKAMRYEKFSIGAELIGLAGTFADAEIIAMSAQGVRQLDLYDCKLVLGHVGLQLHLLSKYNLDSRTLRLLLAQRDVLKDPAQGKHTALENVEHVLAEQTSLATFSGTPSTNTAYDAHHTQEMLEVLLNSTRHQMTMGGRTKNDIAQRLLNKRARTLERERFLEALEFLYQWVNISALPYEAFTSIERWIEAGDERGKRILSQWQQTIDLLKAYDIPSTNIHIQADLTKNWEYYTGLVFGVQSANGDFVAGGGRYDALLQLLGSEQTIPAVGFAYYMVPLLKQLKIQPPSKQLIDFKVEGMAAKVAVHWVNFLRRNGLAIVVQEKSDEDVMLQSGADGQSIIFQNIAYTFDERDALVQQLKAQYP